MRELELPLQSLPTFRHEELAVGEQVDAAHLPGVSIDPERPILLQFTSGSTRTPRGVVVNNRCLVANGELCTESIICEEAGRLVSWLPHHHDLGLFGGLLYPLLRGMGTVHMSPHAFIQRPVRWLRAITRYRATVGGGPPFGYELCSRLVTDEMIEDLDLSTWRHVFCGAEPVNSAPMDRFFSKFAATGLRRESFSPVYGLAETTVFVAGTNHGTLKPPPPTTTTGAREPCRLTDSSRQQIRIVDPDTCRPLPPGKCGEIWVHGPSVSPGYYADTPITPVEFRARTHPDDGHTYFRTGDLGLRQGDWLYVTGRLKDMLILNGVNVHASDILGVAGECDDRLSASAAAVFQETDDVTSDAILLIELPSKRIEEDEQLRLKTLIRARVLTETGVALDDIRIWPRGTLPRTTSGKVQLNLARQQYGEQLSDAKSRMLDSSER